MISLLSKRINMNLNHYKIKIWSYNERRHYCQFEKSLLNNENEETPESNVSLCDDSDRKDEWLFIPSIHTYVCEHTGNELPRNVMFIARFTGVYACFKVSERSCRNIFVTAIINK